MADDWFKLDMDIFGNRKIKYLRRLPDGNSIALFWIALLAEARRCNSDGKVFLTERIPYTPEMLAEEFKFEESVVAAALEAFGQLDMTSVNDGFITITGWEDHQNAEGLAKIREQNRVRKQRQREKQKVIPGLSPPVTGQVTQCHAPDKEEEEKEKNIDLDNNTVRSDPDESEHGVQKPTKADIDSFFESLWRLYPVKKGKGQISEAKRKTLYSVGFEKMKCAIDRYLKELERDAAWRKPQNGSTFFNSGYVDYLDENFVPDKSKQGGRKEYLPGWFEASMGEAERENIQRALTASEQAEAEQLRRELQASFGQKGGG